MKRVSVGRACCRFSASRCSADPRRIDPKAYLEHVKFLASDDLEGRGNGGRGLESAAEYIAARFREAGLEPAGDAGTFFQRFEMTTGLSVEPGNSVTLHSGRTAVAFDVGRDYEIVSTSGDQSVVRGNVAGRVRGLWHFRASPALRRLRGHRRGRQSGADFHARAAGERREKRVRRTNEHAAFDDDAQSRGRAEERRDSDPRRRRCEPSAGDRTVPPMAARAAGRRLRDSGVLPVARSGPAGARHSTESRDDGRTRSTATSRRSRGRSSDFTRRARSIARRECGGPCATSSDS